MCLMGMLTAFVSNTTTALVEHGALPGSRQLDMGNSGLKTLLAARLYLDNQFSSHYIRQ